MKIQKLVNAEHNSKTTIYLLAVEASFKTACDLSDKTNFNSGGITNLKETSLSV